MVDTLIVGCGLYVLTVRSAVAGGSLTGRLALASLVVLLTTSPWALTTTYITERFPTHVRSSGYGVGCGLAVITPPTVPRPGARRDLRGREAGRLR